MQTQFAEKNKKYYCLETITVNEVISGIAEKKLPGGTDNLITKLLEINQNIDPSSEERFQFY